MNTIEYSRQWRRNNPEKLRAYGRKERAKNRLRQLYGITNQDYIQMLERQGGLCAICGKPPTNHRLEVEHDHGTKEVRGLVHKLCNMVIGWAERNPEGARRLLDYLAEK